MSKHSAGAAVVLACMLATGGGRAGDTQSPDPRLDTSVVLNLRHVTLADLCSALSRLTDIDHRIADPYAGDLLLSGAGTLTVAQLHRAVADVLGIQWRQIHAGGEIQYLAVADPARAAEAARAQDEADRLIRADFRRLVNAASLDDQERARLPRQLQDRLPPGSRAVLRLLGSLPSESQACLLDGGVLLCPLSQSTAGQQALVQGMLDEQYRVSAANRPPGTGSPTHQSEPPNLRDGSDWTIRIAPETRQAASGCMVLMVSLQSSSQPGMGWGVPLIEAGPDTLDAGAHRLPGSGRLPATPQPADLLADGHPAGAAQWEDALCSLTRGIGSAVVSDAYLPTEYVPSMPPPARQGEALSTYLDRVCGGSFQRSWGHVGPVLTFRRLDWPIRRRAQMPATQAHRWMHRIIETGRLNLADLIEMISLAPQQSANLADVLGPRADAVEENRQPLLLWQGMSEAARSEALGPGAAIRDLPLTAQPLARALVSTALTTSAPLALSNATIRAEITDQAFTLSVLSPERQPVRRSLELTCPAWWVSNLRDREAARVAALRTAVTLPETSGRHPQPA